MKTKIGVSSGLALTLLVGVFATMLALGMFNTSPVAAQAGLPSVEHIPTGTGDAAKVTVKFVTAAGLSPGDSIMIEFEDDVKVPDVLNPRHVTIGAGGVGSSGNSFVPGTSTSGVALGGSVVVEFVGTPADEALVTIDVGDMIPGDTAPGLQGIEAGSPVTVTFSQSAGITNPTEGGTWNVKVSTTNDATMTSADDNSFDTLRTISLSSKDGERGSKVTVTGAGFKNSTTAVAWLDKNNDRNHDTGEIELCNAVVARDDTFTCDFTVNPNHFPAGVKQYVAASDGRGNKTDEGQSGEWTLKGQVKAVPDEAAIGDVVTLEFRDFPAGQTLSRLRIGSTKLLNEMGGLADSFIPGASNSATITIPNDVDLGKQSLSVATGSGSTGSGTRRDTVNILGARVNVVPDTLVANQSVTISGSGFTGRSVVSSISLGGTDIASGKIDGGDTVQVDDGGNWTATVVIPVEGPAVTPGTYDLKVTDDANRAGVARVTVKGRTISFEPEESHIGTPVTVSGEGWPASNSASGADNTRIEVEYNVGASIEEDATVTADADGRFSVQLTVPRGASIPSTNRVDVWFTATDNSRVTETVSHRVPSASIAISPTSGPGGTTITLTGGGFKGFTGLESLQVSGLNVTPSPGNPNTDRDGNLPEMTVLIPGLDPGTASVRINVGGTVASAPFTVTSGAVGPSMMMKTEDAPVEEFLKDLIDNMVEGQPNLVDAYYLDESTQTYQSYVTDPAFAAFNTLTTVNSGDVLNVRIRAAQTFLGKDRPGPWTNVVVP